MAEKYPISFNDENLKRLEQLEELSGMTGIYGATPKLVKLSINFLYGHLFYDGKVERALSEDELDLLATSEKRKELRRRLEEQKQKLTDQVNKV